MGLILRTLILVFVMGLEPAYASDGAADAVKDPPIHFAHDFNQNLDRRDINAVVTCMKKNYQMGYRDKDEPDVLRWICQGHGLQRFLVSFLLKNNSEGRPEILVEAIKPLTRESEERFWKKLAFGHRNRSYRWPAGSNRYIGRKPVSKIWIEAWRFREFMVMQGLTALQVDGIVSSILYPTKGADHEYIESIRVGNLTYNIRLFEKNNRYYLVELERGSEIFPHRGVNYAVTCRMGLQ